MNLGPAQFALIAAGGILGCAGVWMFARRPKPTPLHIADSGGSQGLSPATRHICCLMLLMGGYHLIIWAFPPYVSAVQLKRELWYVWLLIGIVVIAASLLMDQFDQRDLSDRGDDRP